MKRLAATISILAALAAPALASSAGKPGRSVVMSAVMLSTSGFSSGGGPDGGTLFGGTGQIKQGGDVVGHFSSACISSSQLQGQCNVTMIWKGRGRVQAAGSIRLDRLTNIVTIVGGTGRFRGARGTLLIRRVSEDGSRQRAKLRFTA